MSATLRLRRFCQNWNLGERPTAHWILVQSPHTVNSSHRTANTALQTAPTVTAATALQTAANFHQTIPALLLCTLSASGVASRVFIASKTRMGSKTLGGSMGRLASQISTNDVDIDRENLEVTAC